MLSHTRKSLSFQCLQGRCKNVLKAILDSNFNCPSQHNRTSKVSLLRTERRVTHSFNHIFRHFPISLPTNTRQFWKWFSRLSTYTPNQGRNDRELHTSIIDESTPDWHSYQTDLSSSSKWPFPSMKSASHSWHWNYLFLEVFPSMNVLSLSS